MNEIIISRKIYNNVFNSIIHMGLPYKNTLKLYNNLNRTVIQRENDYKIRKSFTSAYTR
jgi:cobalamin biosynthesis Co2+ chelatase CbiK